MTTEAGIEGMWPQAKECWGHRSWRRLGGTLPGAFSGGHCPATSWFWTCSLQTHENKFLLF